MKRLLKKGLMPLAIILITLAIFFSLFRALTPFAKQYKGKVEEHLTLLLGQPVTISNMETSWYWFEPVLKLDDVVLLDQRKNVLKLNKLLVGIDLLSSLWHWQIKPGVLYLEDVHLTLRQTDQRWGIEGLSNVKQSVSIDEDSYAPVLSWIFSQEKIILKHVSASIYFSDGSTLSPNDINVTATNSYGHYRIKGSAKLLQKIPTEISIIADLNINPQHIRKVNAHVYLSLKQVVLDQWKKFFPRLPVQIKGGQGNTEVWIDFKKGELSSLQSFIHLNDLTWKREGQSKHHRLEEGQANLAWKRTKLGWNLSADKINIKIDGVHWPENSTMFDFQTDTERLTAYIKHVPIQPILNLELPLPNRFDPIVSISPRGELWDSQWVIEKQQPKFILTRFKRLGWNSEGASPSVRELSGVLHWEPFAGRLDLDGENTAITFKKLPKICFDKVNASFSWKQKDDDLRVQIERLILSRPDLVFTAQGHFDNPLKKTAYVQLDGQLSATSAQKWLPYIPSKGLKPKLDIWLKRDIKKIDQVSAEVHVDGMLDHFPFDKSKGEFLINSYLTGVDLYITPSWPLTRDIEAHLHVNKRTLEVDFEYAWIKEVLVDKLSLIVHNIGLGKEALLIHTDVRTRGSQLRDFVYATPIGSRFSHWKQLSLQDYVNLDLRLEVPLYPESDHVYVRGKLDLNNNPLFFKSTNGDIQIDKVTGTVIFDEYGVTSGEVQGALDGSPLVMHISSHRKPRIDTEVAIEGSAHVDWLQRYYSIPVLSFMNGKTNVRALITLTEDPTDYDKLNIDTSLVGVSVDLPPPLGKTKQEVAALSVLFEFSDSIRQKLAIHYKDLVIDANRQRLDEWVVHLAERDLNASLQYHLSNQLLSGVIDRLYLPDLSTLREKMATSKASINPDALPNLDLTIDDFKINQLDIGSIHLKTTKKPNQWILNSVTLKTPEYQMDAEGYWIKTKKHNESNIEGHLKLSNLGKALERFNINPVVQAKRGEINFKGSWPGAFHQFSLSDVSGEMWMRIRDGRITHLDKSTEEKLGLGKLLSILSLQTIPRRLKLDFSDLSKEGYSFDEFKGNFDIKEGILTTDNSYIDGPVAYVSMKGNLDLAKQLYDVDLKVTPYITASLPVVATIAGGPIAGLATWAASKIINKGMQQISGYTYKISGPWFEPVVEQVHIYRKKTNTSGPEQPTEEHSTEQSKEASTDSSITENHTDPT